MSEVKVPREILERMLVQVGDMETLLVSLLQGKELHEVALSEVRYYGPLAEIYNNGMVITSKELSLLMKKYGRNPKGAAGYFSSNSPSMTALGGDKRALT